MIFGFNMISEGVRPAYEPAKIHGLIFNFSTWILQLYSEFDTLPLEFTSLENVFTLVF